MGQKMAYSYNINKIALQIVLKNLWNIYIS